MISRHMLILKQLKGASPPLQFCVDCGFELLAIRIVKRRIRWIERGERFRNALRDRFRNDWIDDKMWIAARVRVTGAGHSRRNIHQTNSLRCFYAS